MTQEEFDKTAFRKGDKVRTESGIYKIEMVYFEEQDLCLFDAPKGIYKLDEILEYIPVEAEGKDKYKFAFNKEKHTTDCFAFLINQQMLDLHKDVNIPSSQSGTPKEIDSNEFIKEVGKELNIILKKVYEEAVKQKPSENFAKGGFTSSDSINQPKAVKDALRKLIWQSIEILKSNGYRVQKKTETWEDC